MQASARLSSSAAFRKVIAGVSTATTRSCYRTSRGKAHAAPLPAQEPPRKGQKRIAKPERRARIVEFVENYRASNEGKFPTIKNIRDQIGGGHYTVRDVLLEMKAASFKRTIEVTVQDKPDSGNQQREIEANKDANASNASDESETHARYNHAEPDPGNQQREIEANKDANASNASDESGSVNEAKTHARYNHAKPDPGNQERVIEANKDANASNASDESGSVNEAKAHARYNHAEPDPGNQQRETEASKDANASNALDESGSVNEAKTHAREDNPKLEESANTGLLGSLKSFAYGIRNFWKNM